MKAKKAMIILALILLSSMAFSATTSLSITPSEKDFWIKTLKIPSNSLITKEVSTFKVNFITSKGIKLTYNIPAIKIGIKGKSYYLISKEFFKYKTNTTPGG